MNATPNLFSRFSDVIRRLSMSEVEDAQSVPELRLASTAIGGRAVEMVYAPFDHVNRSARIVVVGLTPGRQQAANAIGAAQQALRDGATIAEAAERAKIFASFSGPMRSNLIAMLDKLGPKVTAALNHFADIGQISRERILDGMPHPNGANGERIAYFLGAKPAAGLSKKTNAASIDAARANMLRKVALL